MFVVTPGIFYYFNLTCETDMFAMGKLRKNKINMENEEEIEMDNLFLR